MRLCLLFCHSLQHFNTHTDTQKHSNIPFPFLITLFFCLSSVCTSEGILHPSNSPPGSFILRLGRARIPCQRLSLLLNIKSSVSRLRSLLPAWHHAYSGAGGRAIRPASPPKSAIVGISAAITLHE